MSLLPLFHWFDRTALSAVMKDSKWAFAVIEMVHLLGLAVLGGVVLIVNLRLMGLVLRTRPADRIARDLAPFFRTSVAVMVLSGIPLVAEETMKLYYNDAFRLKMLFFALALGFYLFVHRRVTRAPFVSGWAPRMVAGVSLALWLSVGVAGRAIGFL